MQEHAPRHGEADSTDLFDYAYLAHCIGFALRAPLRHKALFAGCVLGALGLAVSALLTLPKTYHVQARILAQRSNVISALSNPNVSRTWDLEAPTRAARETVMKRDNLISLCTQTNLVEQWKASRAPAVRFRDWVLHLFKRVRPASYDERDILVETLAERLHVDVDGGIVTISVKWPDAGMAYRLVEAAMQSFVEARHATEISTIAEAVSILEGHAAETLRRINGTMEEIEAKDRSARPGAPRMPARAGASQAASDESDEIARLRVMFAAKQRAIVDLEEFRRRQLAELQAQLAHQKSIYAEQHPIVVNTQLNIDSLSGESPQVAELRREVERLRRELTRRGASTELSPLAITQPPVVRSEVNEARAVRPEPEDPRLEYSRGQLRLLFNQYGVLLDRIDGARMEMETARADFKYRYSVVTPAQVPRFPIAPRFNLVLLGGLFGGLAFGVFASTARDLSSRRVIERWQVERVLELPILGDLAA